MTPISFAPVVQYPAITCAVLRTLSNLFMTFAWYGHLKPLQGSPWWTAALISWGIALFEYLLQVPANRIGVTVLSLAQVGTLKFGVALQEVAQALRHRKHPLPHRQRWQDAIGEMRCRLHHAPRVARWAHAAPLARERDQEIVPALPALPAPRPGKARRKDSAFQVTAELPLDIRRHQPVVNGCFPANRDVRATVWHWPN